MSRTLTIVAIMWSVGGSIVNDDIQRWHPKSTEKPSSIIPNGIAANGIKPNGIKPNGIKPNGIKPNGIKPNGIKPNGIKPNGIKPNGIKPNDISSEALTLSGLAPEGILADGTPISISPTGAPLAGRHLVGSIWTGYASDGAVVRLRVDAATQGTGDNSDLWAYRMSISADGTWRAACLDASDRPIDAVSVRGTWNYAQGVPGGGSYHPDSSRFTIACRGSAIAKCIEHGYKPWAGATSELAACVRALRADYCGDGTPYTRDGTMVNIFDAHGIQVDAADWVPEAEWTPDGAACISGTKQTRFFQVSHAVPACLPQMLARKRTCGTGFTHGAVLITELAPR